MANPLFYRRVVPLNREIHRELRLMTPEEPYGYARGANLIPALAEEFPVAAEDMAIAFLPGATQPAAVFVTGLNPGTNAFVSAEGRWTGRYVPAYLRRYPFIIGDVPDAEPVLCVDDAYEGFAADEGVRLFSPKGEPEPVVAEALALARGYREAAQRTDRLCRMLQEMALLRAVTLDARLPDGRTTVVHGLLTVDEGALDALPEADLAELHRQGFLKPVFAHLFSLKAASRLAERGPQRASIA